MRVANVIFTLDTEFIDTPTCSALISVALVSEDGREIYYEFQYPEAEITPWLKEHVVSQLSGAWVSFEVAASGIRDFVGGSKFQPPEFWAYYGAYDWYWLARIFGGFMRFPQWYPYRFREFADVQQGVPNLFGKEHHAANDAKSLMAAFKKRRSDNSNAAR